VLEDQEPSEYEVLCYMMGFNAGLLFSEIYEKKTDEEAIDLKEKLFEIFSTTIDRDALTNSNVIYNSQINKTIKRYAELLGREYRYEKKRVL
jgi:hypothetical protein